MAAVLSVALADAWRTLMRHRLRSALCLLSLLFGTSLIIVIVSVVEGAGASVRAQVRSMGDHVITVLPGAMWVGGVRGRPLGPDRLTMGDVLGLRQEVPALTEVCGIRQIPAHVVRGHLNWPTFVIGISSGCLAVRQWPVEIGEPIDPAEWSGGAAIALLGRTTAEALAENAEDLIGQTVLIRGIPFNVRGILAAKGDDLDGDDQDNVAMIPFAAATARLAKSRVADAVDWIVVSRQEDVPAPEVMAEMRAVLRERHGLVDAMPDTFTMGTQSELEAVQRRVYGTVTWLMISLGGLSLVVGGIGVMNMLLVSVRERTREIGIRMAVGATRRQIIIGFLLEALLLGLVGGALGIAVGGAGAWLVPSFLGWPVRLSLWAVIAGAGGALAAGLIFGLYPACQAARLNPIDALRYE